MVICPGNHDVRAPYVDAFLEGASERREAGPTVPTRSAVLVS